MNHNLVAYHPLLPLLLPFVVTMSTSQLDPPKRHITTVLPTGLSAYADLPLSPPPLTIPGGTVFHLAHAVDNGLSGKPTLSNDLERLEEYTTNVPGIVTPGANLRFIVLKEAMSVSRDVC